MDQNRLEHYRHFQQIIADLSATELHDSERLALLDAGEGILLTNDQGTIEDMVSKAESQLVRMSDQKKSVIIEALLYCGPEAAPLAG